MSLLQNLIQRKKYDVTIKFDGRIGFMDNPEDFFNKFKKVFCGIKSKIKIDLKDVEFIYPEVLLFFVCLRETLESKEHTSDFDIKKGSQTHEYLDYSGFCEKINTTRKRVVC